MTAHRAASIRPARSGASYTPPADKSISHRAALFGAMCDEPVTVRNYLDSEDTRSTLDAVQALGAGVEDEGDDCFVDPRRGPARAARGHRRAASTWATPGTLMRLLPGWLAGQPGGVLDARRRRVDPPPARWTAWPSRCG